MSSACSSVAVGPPLHARCGASMPRIRSVGCSSAITPVRRQRREDLRCRHHEGECPEPAALVMRIAARRTVRQWLGTSGTEETSRIQ